MFLSCSLTGTSDDSGKVRPVGSSSTPAPDTVVNEQQQAAAEVKAPAPLKIDTLNCQPSQQPQVTANVSAWLEERNYTIPQTWLLREHGYSNAIRGDFIKKGQHDLAVLAARDTLKDLLVFENSDTTSIIAIFKDVPFGWDVENSYTDSSWIATPYYAINCVDKEYIVDRYEAYGGPEPPEIKHDAINYALLGKTSKVLYFHKGEWIELQGAD